jgi:uncharacterized protein YdhG (YjbR/CyaY superfamily)
MSEAEGFSAEERSAIKRAVYERKRKGKATPEQDVADCQAAIDAMGGADRAVAMRVHEIVMAAVPAFAPKTWYGMPAYQIDGKTICFFQSAAKFKTRYSTLGFTDNAKLDEGTFWPNAYALTQLTPVVEKQIAALVTRASK